MIPAEQFIISFLDLPTAVLIQPDPILEFLLNAFLLFQCGNRIPLIILPLTVAQLDLPQIQRSLNDIQRIVAGGTVFDCKIREFIVTLLSFNIPVPGDRLIFAKGR